MADLLLPSRLSAEAVYDALSHDVLREQDAALSVTRYPFDFGDRIAPIMEQGRWSAGLPVDDVSPRVGWGRPLAM